MKMICVFVAACLALAAADECPSLADGKLEKLRAKLITENIHDKLVGERKGVWGPKQFLQVDPQACVKHTAVKIDDKVLEQTEAFRNKGFVSGEFKVTSTLEKLENGIYLLKKKGVEPFGKIYFVYAKDNVYAYLFCKLNAGQEAGKKKWTQSPISYLMVDAKDAKSPLDEPIQKNVNEAVGILQSSPELFGEIAQITNFC